MFDYLTRLSSRKWIFWLLPFAIPTLLMLPVLFWPHYGLFSDAGQIIEFPKTVLSGLPDSLKLLKPLPDGRWNPLFHGFSLLLYFLVPDSARVFYVAQWLMFVAATTCLAWVVVRLTSNTLLAWLSVILFSTASSIFENFYTLDKVEPRVTFLVALFAVSVVTVFKNRNYDANFLRNWRTILLQILLGIGIVFSKETGIFIAAALGVTWIGTFFNKSLESKFRWFVFHIFAAQLTVVVVYLFLFKLFAPPMNNRYISYDVTLYLIFKNISYYVLSSPELAIGLILACYWAFQILFEKLPGPRDSNQSLYSFFSFSLLAYFAGICLWRWPLDYYLLPAHFFSALLISLSSYELILKRKNCSLRTKRFIIVSGGIVWSFYFLYRVFVGIGIFSFDQIKDDLAQYLANSSYIGKRLVLPFKHPDNAEIGERLEFFINKERLPIDSVVLYNFWEPSFLNRQNLERFDGGAGIPPNKDQLYKLSESPAQFAIWQFGKNEKAYIDRAKVSSGFTDVSSVSNDNLIWHQSFLNAGDLILLPTGSESLKVVRARGIAMHARSAKSFIQETPLDLFSVGQIKRGLGPFWLGWEIFEVRSIPVENAVNGDTPSILKGINRRIDIVPVKSLDIFFEKNSPTPTYILI